MTIDCKPSFVGICSVELDQLYKWSSEHTCKEMIKQDIGELGIAPSYFWEVTINPNTIGYDAKVRCRYCGVEESIHHDHD